MRKYITVFGLLTATMVLLAAVLLVRGRIYETGVGCVCCGVILYVAAVSGWVTWEAWREERRRK